MNQLLQEVRVTGLTVTGGNSNYYTTEGFAKGTMTCKNCKCIPVVTTGPVFLCQP